MSVKLSLNIFRKSIKVFETKYDELEVKEINISHKLVKS